MDWPIILLGVIIGLMVAASKGRSLVEKRGTPQPSRRFIEDRAGDSVQHHEPNYADCYRRYLDGRIGTNYNTFTSNLGNDPGDYLRRIPWRRPRIDRYNPELYISQQMANQNLDTKILLKTWRKSVVGLVKLAERNVVSAKQYFELKHFTTAVDLAMTSVENIARALIHCCGEKPDVGSGQEEMLRIMLRRFHEEEKSELERAIDSVATICRNKIVLKHLIAQSIEAQLLNEAGTKQILESASAIVSLFRDIIEHHFATEIPELQEKCPKCHGLDISIWGFSQESTTCRCNVCDHKWIQSNAL